MLIFITAIDLDKGRIVQPTFRDYRDVINCGMHITRVSHGAKYWGLNLTEVPEIRELKRIY